MAKPGPFIFYRYVTREHLGPFLFSISLIAFLFLMNFTIREANKLFGRGLDPVIIIRMFYYHLAPTLALAVPMSVLVATTMAFVRIATDSEITILRSAGVHLNRILNPLILFALLIGVGMFFFNNTVLPDYNYQSAQLSREIRRLKPTAAIYPNTFTKIKDIQLYVKRLDDSFNENITVKQKLFGDAAQYPIDHMYDVILIDNQNPEVPRTMIAREAYLFLNEARRVFEFHLMNGESFETSRTSTDEFRHSEFNRTVFIIPADDYVMDEEAESRGYKSVRQQNVDELAAGIEVEKQQKIKRIQNMVNFFDKSGRIYNRIDTTFSRKLAAYERWLGSQTRLAVSTQRSVHFHEKDLRQLKGEWHKKYAIPFASVLFVLIGAPLGILTRKGEAGKAAAVCLLVFVMYYVFMILGEEWSDAGFFPSWIGIWSGNIFGAILAVISYFELRRERSLADYLNLPPALNRLFSK